LVWKYGVSLGFNDEPLTITVESNAEFQSEGRTEIFSQEIIRLRRAHAIAGRTPRVRHAGV
jgi:hypothetical protein